jgi:hypothetical protein
VRVSRFFVTTVWVGAIHCGGDGHDVGDARAADEAVSSACPEASVATAGDVCGGPMGTACGAGLYCELAAGDACGALGTCKARPEVCPFFCLASCRTCDGARACNPCLAAQAGETVSSKTCP